MAWACGPGSACLWRALTRHPFFFARRLQAAGGSDAPTTADDSEDDEDDDCEGEEEEPCGKRPRHRGGRTRVRATFFDFERRLNYARRPRAARRVRAARADARRRVS
jgi:hypothetical protein